MAKQSLESQVRRALIQQRTDELVRYAVENPNYRTMVTEMVETMGDSMIKSIASSLGDVDEEEKKEMLAEYRAEVPPRIRAEVEAVMDNPQQLRQLMEKQAMNNYLSYRQLKTKIGSINKRLGKQGFGELNEGMFQYARTNDKIIRRLATIAKQEGLDVATQKDTRYRVTRELLPTPDAYKAVYAIRGLYFEDARKFSQQAQSSFLMADGRAGQLRGSKTGAMAMGKLMEKALEIRRRAEGDYLKKAIEIEKK